jgi:hypothetical protein
MTKFLWLVLASACFSLTALSQDTAFVPVNKKTDWSKVNLGNRANDHFMIEFGYDGWAGTPDTINISGFSRHFNFYVMYDLPFKTAPRLSVAAGVGMGTSSIFFDNTSIDIAGKNGNKISFTDVSKANHFKKYKINNSWIEVPVELRFVTDPLHTGRSFKVALGVKIGTMIDAHTKGKNLETAEGNSLYGTKYIEKEKSKTFFNSTRFAGTMRVGYGPFTVYGAYQINKLFKDVVGPDVHPFSIGLCLSGL